MQIAIVIRSFIGSLLFLCTTHAYIYQLTVFQKWMPEKSCYQYVLGCGDFHDKVHDANVQQLNFITHMLSQTARHKVRLIIEDLSSRNTDGRNSCGEFYIDSRGGVLGGLTQLCNGLNLDVDNIEYRYCRVASLGPVLNNIESNLYDFTSVAMIPVQSLVDEVEQIVQEIKMYSDEPLLRDYYNEIISDVALAMRQFGMPRAAKQSVAYYIDRYSKSTDRFELVKELLTFDSPLLDVKMIHTIANCPTENIVVFAGGAHLDRVQPILEKIGYTNVYTSRPAFVQEYDLRRCLGSNVMEGSFCVRPEPIDITVLQRFLQ